MGVSEIRGALLGFLMRGESYVFGDSSRSPKLSVNPHISVRVQSLECRTPDMAVTAKAIAVTATEGIAIPGTMAGKATARKATAETMAETAGMAREEMAIGTMAEMAGGMGIFVIVGQHCTFLRVLKPNKE